MRRFAFLPFAVLLLACSSSTMTPPPPNYGTPCTGPGPTCVGGATCATGGGLTTGFCTATCTPGDTTCGTAHCSTWFGAGLCLPVCTTGADCMGDFQCWQGTCVGLCSTDDQCGVGGAARCGDDRHCAGPECTTPADCGVGRTCSSGRCFDIGPDGGPVILHEGDPCAASNDCDVGLVCLPSGLGGTCAHMCTHTPSCAVGQICVPAPIDHEGDGVFDATVTACIADDRTKHINAESCATDAQCDDGLCLIGQCHDVCVDATDCLLGQICVGGVTLDGAPPTPFSACGYTLATGVDVIDIPLGTSTVSTTSESPNITVALDPTAVSVTFIAQQLTGAYQTIAFVDVFDPDETHIYSIAQISTYQDTSPIRWIPSGTEGAAAMLVPNTTSDRVNFLDGRYTVDFGISAPAGVTASADVTLTARVKRSAGPLTAGTLDLNVFVITTGITAASAPGNSFLQTALTEMTSLYSSMGIAIGTIRYIDVSASQFATFHFISSVDGPTSELSQMFMASGGRTENALDLFLVDRIEVSSGEGLVTLGIAGGIPGPPGVHGTPHSGVAVIMDPGIIGGGTGGAHRLGQVMAHEMGHYLGFFHNAEGTRPCAAGEIPTMSSPCAPFGGGDVLADTPYGDTNNVMYWVSMGGRTFTSGQGYVALRNPLVR